METRLRDSKPGSLGRATERKRRDLGAESVDEEQLREVEEQEYWFSSQNEGRDRRGRYYGKKSRFTGSLGGC